MKEKDPHPNKILTGVYILHFQCKGPRKYLLQRKVRSVGLFIAKNNFFLATITFFPNFFLSSGFTDNMKMCKNNSRHRMHFMNFCLINSIKSKKNHIYPWWPCWNKISARVYTLYFQWQEPRKYLLRRKLDRCLPNNIFLSEKIYIFLNQFFTHFFL